MHSGPQSCRVQHTDLRGLLGLDWHLNHRGLRLKQVARQGLAADLAVEVPGDLGVKLEEVARVVATLAKLSVAVKKGRRPPS
jgi:hypothetical protein